jgi:hypothetical protein
MTDGLGEPDDVDADTGVPTSDWRMYAGMALGRAGALSIGATSCFARLEYISCAEIL